MSNPEWMGQRVISDVQIAIQSQAIQTALESNTSKITDLGFQSFLTTAPIPRFYNNSVITSVHGAASNVVTTYNAAVTFDPYKTFNAATGTWTAPISGFYHHWYNLTCTGGAGGFIQLIFLTSAGTAYSSVFANAAAGTALYQLEVNTIVPHTAGDTVRLQIGNNTVAGLTLMVPLWGSVWTAPFTQYTTGSGGN